MTVQTPTGWNTFTGGGIVPELCAEQPQDGDTPGEIPPLTISGNKLSLSCTFADYSLDLTIEGGAPPFIWVATGGFLAVTGVRTATLAIHELGSVVNFFKPRLTWTAQDCADATPCGTNGPPGTPTYLTELVAQTFLFAYDCLGLQIPLHGSLTDPILVYDVGYPNAIGDDLTADSDHYITANWDGSVTTEAGPCNPHDIESWASGKCWCTEPGDLVQSVTARVVTAGKDCINGTVWNGAVEFNETLNIPLNSRGACNQLDPPAPGYGGTIDYTQSIDVRTQAIVDEECCVSPIGTPIVVTVADAVGAVSFLNIPVV